MPIMMAVIICIHVLSSKYIVWWCIATYSRSIGIVINCTYSVDVNCHFWVLLLIFLETCNLHSVCIWTYNNISYLDRICHYLLAFRDNTAQCSSKACLLKWLLEEFTNALSCKTPKDKVEGEEENWRELLRKVDSSTALCLLRESW